MTRTQQKLSQGNLLDQQGHLIDCGYAHSLERWYDRRAIRAASYKIKEWDYYLIYNQDFGIALTIADNSYMGLISATFLDFKTKQEHTLSPMIPLTFGKLKLPDSSEIGDLHYKNKSLDISFSHETNCRHLMLQMEDFEDNQPLLVDVKLTDFPQDSMVIVTPFKNAPKAFYYNQKIVGMRAQGTVQFKGKTHLLSSEDSFGILDWGRGVWTYDNTWYWSAGNGLIDGKVFGFNLGYGFGDTSAATENMLFYEGKAHKLEDVTFSIPIMADGKEDYMVPWLFTSSDGRFEALFTPILDRAAYTSLGIILSDQHQVFGYFDGKALLDDGQIIEMTHFLGFAEKVRNKW